MVGQTGITTTSFLLSLREGKRRDDGGSITGKTDDLHHLFT